MIYGVKKHTLLYIAGCVWIIAGANILRIGIVSWEGGAQDWLLKLGGVVVVFLFFFYQVFKRHYKKHSIRILQKKGKSCPLSFFDTKGWGIMIFMIAFGITIRKFHLLPNAFISVFYTGLSTALMLTGTLFVRQGYKTPKSQI